METISNEQRRSIEGSLRDTLRMLAKWEARRLYVNPQGETETNYNNETLVFRASYRRHASYLNHMLTTGVWSDSHSL